MPYADPTSKRARQSATTASRRYYWRHREKILARNKQYRHMWDERYASLHADRKKRAVRDYKDRKIAWLRSLKAERGCIRCGIDNPIVLDFHHRDPAKKTFSISEGIVKGRDKILAEIEKCDVLCANCHRIHTHSKRNSNE